MINDAPSLFEHELIVLEMLAGKRPVERGAWVSACLEFLNGAGLCTPGPKYKITDKGRAMLGTRTGFAIGDRVLKHTGDYQLEGEVRGVITTKAGKVRYVVEHSPGFLHIYSAANLTQIKEHTNG